MTPAQLIPLLINVSIFLIVFAIGLKAHRGDVVYLLSRPGLLFRSLLSMNAIMPLVAVLIALLFDLAPAIEVALVALSVSPVPPILPNKQMKAGGSGNYAIGLLVAASIASIILAPVAVALAAIPFAREATVSISRMASIVLLSIAIPLGVGILVRTFFPSFAARIARPASLAGLVLLAAAVIPVLFSATASLWQFVGNGVLIVLAVFSVCGLLVGHFLGGPNPEDRAVLALATSTRHPGIAIAIAQLNFPDDKATLAVILYHLVIGAIVAIPYMRWRRASSHSGEVA